MTDKPISTEPIKSNLDLALNHLNLMLSDLPGSAAAISSGEFSKSGAGNAGGSFRKISEVSDAEMMEVWSTILIICTKLWEADFHSEATELLELCSRNFHISPEFEVRIETSLKKAKEHAILTSAEKSFTQGDDEEAIRQTELVKDAWAHEFNDDLRNRITRRKKSRQVAIWMSGVSIAMLLVMASIGGISSVKLLKDPPRPEMPKFEESSRIFKSIFEDDNSNATIDEPIPQASSLPQAPIPDQGALNPTNDIFQKSNDTAEITSIEKPKATRPPATKSTTKNAPMPQAPNTVVTRANCILGYAALQKAMTITSTDTPNDRQSKNLARFLGDLKKSCSSYEIDAISLSLETGTLDPDQVTTVAQGILTR